MDRYIDMHTALTTRRSGWLYAAGALALLSACSNTAAVNIGDKTRFVAELIDPRAECQSYHSRLLVPARDLAALDGVYKEAKLAHCLKPDV